MFYMARLGIFQKAKELRENVTPPKKRVWDKLKNNQLGTRFKAQHPIERFIVDFYCHEYKLVIEIDGQIHNGQKDYDLGRTVELEKYGIKVLRFSNEEVANNLENVINTIRAHLG